MVETYEFPKHAFIQHSFRFPTPVAFPGIQYGPFTYIPYRLRQYLVVGLYAVPTLIKRLETVLPHLSDPNGFVQRMAHKTGVLTEWTNPD